MRARPRSASGRESLSKDVGATAQRWLLSTPFTPPTPWTLTHHTEKTSGRQLHLDAKITGRDGDEVLTEADTVQALRRLSERQLQYKGQLTWQGRSERLPSLSRRRFSALRPPRADAADRGGGLPGRRAQVHRLLLHRRARRHPHRCLLGLPHTLSTGCLLRAQVHQAPLPLLQRPAHPLDEISQFHLRPVVRLAVGIVPLARQIYALPRR